jgi:NifU-like protein involved in Fe-S cluster formation
MEDATVVAVAGNPACGDMITFYLKIDEAKQVIEKASFESYGCAANIATSSIVTEMIKGLTLEQAWNDITWKKVTEEIGGLPSVKFHCGISPLAPENEQSENTSPNAAQSQTGFRKKIPTRRNRRLKRKNWRKPCLNG